jgi:transcriptional regulator with XRE-family HTH domain
MKGGSAMEKMRLGEAVRRHGFRRTCREAGVSLATLETTVRGMRVPKEATAEKIADALGVSLDEIAWPLGYGERLPGGALRVGGQIDDLCRVAPQEPVQVDEN